MPGNGWCASVDSLDYKSYFIAIYVYHFPTIVAIDSQNVTFILYGLYNDVTKPFPVLALQSVSSLTS